MPLLSAKKYFELNAVNDSEFERAIPELLQVIEGLKPLRNSKNKTRDYILTWLEPKCKRIRNLTEEEEREEEIEFEKRSSFENVKYLNMYYEYNFHRASYDYTEFDNCLSWIFKYFNYLNKNKTGKAISYAYALEALSHLEDQADRLNIQIHKFFAPPSYYKDDDDVIEAIAREDNTEPETVITPNAAIRYEDLPHEILKENYDFWMTGKMETKQNKVLTCTIGKNIFQNITKEEFLQMIMDMDFTKIYTRGKQGRVQYNIYILTRIMGTDWGNAAAKKIGTTYEQCRKAGSFSEHDNLKHMYL